MRKIKTKDIVMAALLTALYMVFYAVSGVGVLFLGQIGHAISPGITGLLTGAIFIFITRRIGKFGQFIFMQAICMVLFSIMGAGYLPWLITSMLAAVIADLIASRSEKPAIWKVAIASGIFHVGQAWGSIVPSWFFLESYKTEWISRGQTPEAMEEMVRYTTGFMGVVSTLIVFVLAFAGVFLGWLILKNHLKENQKENNQEA